MCVGYNILDDAAEAGIYENWCLLDNKTTFNAFINGNYMLNIIDAPGGQYILVHYNSVVTYSNNIGDLPT